MILGPERVRAVLRDGTEVPVEVAYAYTDDDGIAIWRNIHPIRGDFDGHVRAALLPPKVGIEIIVEFD